MGNIVLDLMIVGSFFASQNMNVSDKPEYNEAFRNGAFAYYHYSGAYDSYRDVTKKYKAIYKDTIPSTQRKYLTWMFLTVKTIQDQQIVYVWEF